MERSEKLQQIISKLERSLLKAQETNNDMLFQTAFSYSFIDPENTPDRQLKTLEDPLEGLAAMLELIERFPDNHYFYEPDYLGLYFEHYRGKGYEELLLQSVERCPIAYTLHLLHGVINDTTGPHYAAARSLLNRIAQGEKYPAVIRADAAERVAHIEEQERPLDLKNVQCQIVSLQDAILRFDLENIYLREEDKQSAFDPDTLADTYADPLVIVFEGDTELKEDIRLSSDMLRSLSEFGTPPVSDFHKLLLGNHAYQNRILIINGNLTVPIIDMRNIDCLFVFGNVECEKITFYEHHTTWIKGNLSASRAILGCADSDDDGFLEEKGARAARVSGAAFAPRVQTWYMRLSHLNWAAGSGDEFAEDEELEPEQHLTDSIW